MSYNPKEYEGLRWRASRKQKYSPASARTAMALIVALSFFLAFVFPARAPALSPWFLPGLSYYAFLEQSLPVPGGEVMAPEARSEAQPFSSVLSVLAQDYPRHLINQEFTGLGELEPGFPAKDELPAENQVPEGSPQEHQVEIQNEEEVKPEPLGTHTPGVSESDGSMHLQQRPETAPAASDQVAGQPPKVLIYHTHSTESFVPETGTAFSKNMDKTVVVLGKKLAGILEDDYGIPVLHNTEIFDLPRSKGYANALPRIEEILAENPQVEVVLDLHRDGVPRSVTTMEIEGKPAGRLLFVVGTRHKQWSLNMRFALFLQQMVDERYPGLSRGVRKQNYAYNQHLHERSLIVEVGGHENTLQEVRKTIPYLAEVISEAFS